MSNTIWRNEKRKSSLPLLSYNMIENIKKIMISSFDNKFFVEKNNKENNRLYIGLLVDKLVEDICEIQKMDYEEIAELICILDKRIKSIFEVQYGLLSAVLLEFDWLDIFSRYIFLDLNNKVLTELVDEITCYDELKILLANVSVLENWNKLSDSDREIVISDMCEYINRSVGIHLESNSTYEVKVYDGGIKRSIILNQLINFIAKKKSIIFIYQTIDAITMLRDFEIREMYRKIYEELSECKMNPINDNSEISLISNITQVELVECVGRKKYEYLYSELNEKEKTLLDSIIHMKKSYFEILQGVDLEIAKLRRDNNNYKKENVNYRQKSVNDEKKIINIIRENDELRKENDKLKKKNEEKDKVVYSELYSLRNYMFSMQFQNDTEKEKEKDEEYIGKYDEVVIIGGHIRWHTKVLEMLPGIAILNTDQNVVDWAFIDKMKVVVFVTNYISHSMYYRAIERITNQKILYVNYKNVEQLRGAINREIKNNS